MRPFTYTRVEDAAAAVASVTADREAMFLAGGTNLVDHLKLGIAAPSTLVDVTGLTSDRVEDLPGDDVRDELQIDDPLELTGLYDGIPLTEKSISEPQPFPDTVWLFRRAILDEWAERGDVSLGALVRNVVIHEFAHHFGWSDEDIARIDRWWE